jgi:hypothetical protein
VPELEEAFGLDEVIQPVDAEVAEPSIGFEEVTRCPREDDLAAVRRCSDARGAMHVETDVALRRYERLSRVNPDTNPNRAVGQPVTNLVGSRYGVRCSPECCEECVTLRVHLDSRVPGESSTNHGAVSAEEIRVRGAVLVQEFRRSCDVGEHERYGAAREVFSHAELIIEPRRVSRLVRDSVRDAFPPRV